MRTDDVEAVTQLMETTIVLGQPVAGVDLGDYVRACLSPFVGRRARDAAVVVDDDGRIVAYALVCTDPPSGERAARRAVVGLVMRTLVRGAHGGLGAATRRFYVDRLRDMKGLASSAGPRRANPHAHLNIAAGTRSGTAALLLLEHVDTRVALAGFEHWVGEVNAPSGRRARALERLGFEVVDRRPNLTLSRCAGQPVERLTLLRRIPR
jgi:hypothetical protein